MPVATTDPLRERLLAVRALPLTEQRQALATLKADFVRAGHNLSDGNDPAFRDMPKPFFDQVVANLEASLP